MFQFLKLMVLLSFFVIACGGQDKITTQTDIQNQGISALPQKTFYKTTGFISDIKKPAFIDKQSGAYQIPQNRESVEIQGQYIVRVKDSASLDDVLLSYEDIKPIHTFRYALKGFSAQISHDLVVKIKKDRRIQSISLDRTIYAFAQTLPTGLNRIDAELNTTSNINGIDERINIGVAVIDTGIQTNHSDLNVVGGANFVTSGKRTMSDLNGHGTHVAGTIAAIDNGNGVVGIAPGANLYAVRVLDSSGSGSFSWIIAGIDWVTANADKIKVANMSLGATCSYCTENSTNATIKALQDAITASVNAGVTYVVAAGNDSANSANTVPAAFGGSGLVNSTITVSALADFDGTAGGLGTATCRSDVDDSFASFSNFGTDVDIMAPGVCIYSTWIGSSYNTISGTSMATPHVTGAVAVALYAGLASNPAEVKSYLLSVGNSVPCANASTCSDDPDGVQEPLLQASFLSPCTLDSECDDANLCTTDTCDLNTGLCSNIAIVCDDANACTTDSCNSITGACSAIAINCDDNNVCNGTESCDSFSGCYTATTPGCTSGDGCCPTGCTSANDSDCQTCLNIGSSCTSNSQCCSLACKGKPGKKTCQ